MATNWDKKNGPVPKTPRPYKVDNDQITAKPISLARAKEVYKIKITTKTDDEIREANRIFLENQKKQG